VDAKSQYAEFERAVEDLKRAAREEYQQRVIALDAALAVAREIAIKRPAVEAMKSEEAPVAAALHAVPDVEPDAERATEAAQHSMWEDSPKRNVGSKPFKLKDEVERAYKEFNGGVFRQIDVTHAIREKFPSQTVYPGSVSAALGRFAAEGKLLEVKPAGGGSDPALYQEASVPP
jgi:hypothetical protein